MLALQDEASHAARNQAFKVDITVLFPKIPAARENCLLFSAHSGVRWKMYVVGRGSKAWIMDALIDGRSEPHDAILWGSKL